MSCIRAPLSILVYSILVYSCKSALPVYFKFEAYNMQIPKIFYTTIWNEIYFAIVKYLLSGITCEKPSITDGTVNPSNATAVVYGSSYEVTCNTDFRIVGSTTMTCSGDGNFDQTPTCAGKSSSKTCRGGSSKILNVRAF